MDILKPTNSHTYQPAKMKDPDGTSVFHDVEK